MRIKHWSGYGTLDIKKVSEFYDGNLHAVIVMITGNHEQGHIGRYMDERDVGRWVGKRFDKNAVCTGFTVMHSGYHRNETTSIDVKHTKLLLEYAREA